VLTIGQLILQLSILELVWLPFHDTCLFRCRMDRYLSLLLASLPHRTVSTMLFCYVDTSVSQPKEFTVVAADDKVIENVRAAPAVELTAERRVKFDEISGDSDTTARGYHHTVCCGMPFFRSLWSSFVFGLRVHWLWELNITVLSFLFQCLLYLSDSCSLSPCSSIQQAHDLHCGNAILGS
jgi:hypothetical protein